MSTTPTSTRPVTPTGILVERLRGLRDRLGDLDVIDQTVLVDLDETLALADGLDPYVERCTTPASPTLRELSRRTAQTPWGDDLEQEMLSGHVEGQLLRMLVQVTGARRVLEIGTFTGYATLAMAEALHDVEREQAGVVTCEVDAHVASIAREGFDASPAGGLIDLRVGPASETLSRLAAEGQSFDFVFVDADKAGYVDYLMGLLEWGLLTPGALIAVDNTLMQGEAYLAGARTANGEAIAGFNDVVAADSRLEQVLLPVRDGVTLIRQVRR